MKKLFLFLFLISCVSPKNEIKNELLNFDKDLTFDEFNTLIIRYAEISAYPDID